MNLFWLGGVAEEEKFKKRLEKGNTQIAANITQLNYIEGLEEVTGQSLKILNSHYEPSFPKYKELFVKRKKWVRKGKENIDIGFINIPVFKYINKAIVLRREMKKILKKELTPNDLNIFFIYAMTSPLMLIAPFIKRYIKREKYAICLIVPDLPEFMNMTKQSKLRKILSIINKNLIYKCMRYIDKYVLFAEPMAEYLKLNKNQYIVIEGMVNLKRNSKKKSTTSLEKQNYIMYAGGMNKKYGVLNLANAFSEIKNSNIELWLYGNGDAVEEIKNLSLKDKRIKYKGIVNNEEILIAEQNAKLLINPRPTNEEYTKYSFPSKNMEYMLSGTPLLTTKIPSMPKEYYEYIYTFEKEDINEFKVKLEEVLGYNEEILINKGKKAKEYVMKEKNNVIQSKKIIEFITKNKS